MPTATWKAGGRAGQEDGNVPCLIANPSPSVLGRGPACFDFVNMLLATKFRKRLNNPPASIPARDSAGREVGENQRQKQTSEARGPSGLGGASPEPRREDAEAPACSIPITEVAQAAPRANTRLVQAASPLVKRNLPSPRDEWHPQEATPKKNKSPITTSLRNSLGPAKADQRGSLIISHPGPCFPSPAALRLQGS